VSPPAPTPIDAFLRALLRGEEAVSAGLEPEAVLRRARVHGVEGLLMASCATGSQPGLREAALAFAAWEMRHRVLLVRALEALEAAGTPAILLKGGALAYSLYSDPALRTRADTDLLVPEHSADTVRRALEHCGFNRVPGAASYQSTFARADVDGCVHALDVHWRINNSELLAQRFDYAELAAASMPLQQLAPCARAPSYVDSLLIACMHRATHKHYAYHVDGEDHHDPDRLIWLYDLHLLARQLGEGDWQEFVDQAARKGLRAVSSEGLSRARDCFGTVVPAHVWRALQTHPLHEDPARYLASSPARRTWMDVRAMPGWSRRLQWLRDLCFPPDVYMRAKFARANAAWLPSLYLRRAVAGLWKRLVRA
jgi:hypothetical protein